MTVTQAALATLGRCLEALAGELTEAERARVIALAEQARRLLKAAASRTRVSTEALAVRVEELERALADRDPGERRDIICTRLGLSRATFYRLASLTKVRRGRDTLIP